MGLKRLQWGCGIKDMLLMTVLLLLLLQLLLLLMMMMMMVVVVVILRRILSIPVTFTTDDEMRWPVNEEGRRYRQ
jgi:hypothetical protein